MAGSILSDDSVVEGSAELLCSSRLTRAAARFGAVALAGFVVVPGAIESSAESIRDALGTPPATYSFELATTFKDRVATAPASIDPVGSFEHEPVALAMPLHEVATTDIALLKGEL